MSFLPAAGALLGASVLFAAGPPPAASDDCPMFGRTVERNMANPLEKNLPDTWSVKKNKLSANVKWKAPLGGMAFGGPVVAGGKIFVGSNNDHPADPTITGDKGVMLCFNAADGAFLWQIVHDKLPQQDLDAGDVGIASTPAVDGDRLYYVSNRCELVCADVAGDPAQKGKGNIIRSLDMIKDLKVYPGGIEGGLANCSPLVLGDLVYVVTSNGVSGATEKPPNPDAPSFVAVRKSDGKVAWSSNLPGPNILDGQWGNPAAAEVNGVSEVIFPGGDGWLYGFEAKKGDLLWKFDCNPKKSDFKPKSGTGDRNYIVATPVVVDGKVYVGVGREPDAGPGVGHFWCVDVAKKPDPKTKDLSPVNDNYDPKAPENKDSGLVWHFGGMYNPKPAGADRDFPFGRTVSTAAVHDGLVYAAELDGFLHCLDAQTGQEYWVHDLGGAAWSSPYYADGKVYMGVDNADLLIFQAGKTDKEPAKIEMQQSMKVPLVAANGVLYVNNGLNLYAITK
jgi:outer membrane protein assembly factor BamB